MDHRSKYMSYKYRTLRRKHSGKWSWHWVGQCFLSYSTKSPRNKIKRNTLDFIRFKKRYLLQIIPSRKWKENLQNGESICKSLYYKGPEPRWYKLVLQTNDKTFNLIEKWGKDVNSHFPQKIEKWPISTWKGPWCHSS